MLLSIHTPCTWTKCVQTAKSTQNYTIDGASLLPGQDGTILENESKLTYWTGQDDFLNFLLIIPSYIIWTKQKHPRYKKARPTQKHHSTYSHIQLKSVEAKAQAVCKQQCKINYIATHVLYMSILAIN